MLSVRDERLASAGCGPTSPHQHYYHQLAVWFRLLPVIYACQLISSSAWLTGPLSSAEAASWLLVQSPPPPPCARFRMNPRSSDQTPLLKFRVCSMPQPADYIGLVQPSGGVGNDGDAAAAGSAADVRLPPQLDMTVVLVAEGETMARLSDPATAMGALVQFTRRWVLCCG
jgi:hypothetical protein